jgi:uncharacterized membrane protein YeiH
MQLKTASTILIADLIGTCLFAIEGALTAMQGGLDLLGILVIAFVAALGGGVVRDLLIGAVPPSAIRDWRYPMLTFAAGLFTFAFHAEVQAIPAWCIIVLDAAGLALFAMAGVEKAIAYGIKPFVAMLMGTVTGVGGGVIRDILLARVPVILHTDIYATAAFAGSFVALAARRFGWSPASSAIAGGAVCFLLRIVAVWQGWHLPKTLAG